MLHFYGFFNKQEWEKGDAYRFFKLKHFIMAQKEKNCGWYLISTTSQTHYAKLWPTEAEMTPALCIILRISASSGPETCLTSVPKPRDGTLPPCNRSSQKYCSNEWLGSREMAQQGGALPRFPEDLSSVPRDLTLSSGRCEHPSTWHTLTHREYVCFICISFPRKKKWVIE